MWSLPSSTGLWFKIDIDKIQSVKALLNVCVQVESSLTVAYCRAWIVGLWTIWFTPASYPP